MQYSTRLAHRFGLTLFSHPRSIFLPVHARAAGKRDGRSNEPIEEIARAIQVDSPINIGLTSMRARAQDHRVEIFRTGVHLISLRDIDWNNRIRFAGEFGR